MLERDDLEPGSTLTWSARLFAPTGDVIAESETAERVLEILGAPSVAAETRRGGRDATRVRGGCEVERAGRAPVTSTPRRSPRRIGSRSILPSR